MAFRDNKNKQLIFSIVKYILTFVIFYWAMAGIHEWFHLVALRALGGDGYVVSTWFGGGVEFTKWPTNPDLVAYVGGLGVALIYGITMIFDWLSYDTPGSAALFPIVTAQATIGILEGMFIMHVPRAMYQSISTGGFVVSLGIGFVISLFWLINDLLKQYDKK